MNNISNIIQSGDWKNEKHVPVIDGPINVNKDEDFSITVSIGKEISHPNTFDHHIKWIKVFYKSDKSKFPIQLSTVNFTSHGENSIYTDYKTVISTKITQSGTIFALSYCNIHGLWENSFNITCV